VLALDEYGLALHSLDELVSFRMLPYSECALLTLELPPQIAELSRELSQTTQKLEAMQRLYEAELAVARQSAEHSRRDSEQMSRLEGRLADALALTDAAEQAKDHMEQQLHAAQVRACLLVDLVYQSWTFLWCGTALNDLLQSNLSEIPMYCPLIPLMSPKDRECKANELDCLPA